MFDLNSLIDASDEWTLSIALDISNTGLIVGWGTRNGEARSFLLRPVPEPATWLLAVVATACWFVHQSQPRPLKPFRDKERMNHVTK
jgi:hypothetical protein